MYTAFLILTSLCVLGCTLALPTLDWSKIQHKNIYLEEPATSRIYSHHELIQVIGGHEAEPNSSPYMVAILVNGNLFCGASLIAKNWVLTAAHCTDGGSYVYVILGAHRALEVETTQLIINSNNIINHPDWNRDRLIHDVALIKLPLSVTFTNYIQAIAIAPANSGSFAGATGLLTGWGYTSDESPGFSDTLQQVHLRIISTAECREYAGVLAHETNLCTHGFNGNHNVGSCFGDSGSPIVVDDVQVGIVSFGSTQCGSGSITSYARVSSYANWIDSYTKSKHYI